MNSFRSNNLSLKYQRFTSSGSKDVEFVEFVATTQFLYNERLDIIVERFTQCVHDLYLYYLGELGMQHVACFIYIT